MTIEEKAIRIEMYCRNHACEKCPLQDFEEPCYEKASVVERNYDILFRNADDPVNHPSHYTGKFECIDVMTEVFGEEYVKGFCLCNSFKYLYRCKAKYETPTEDIKKANWYLNKFIEMEDALHDQI